VEGDLYEGVFLFPISFLLPAFPRVVLTHCLRVVRWAWASSWQFSWGVWFGFWLECWRTNEFNDFF